MARKRPTISLTRGEYVATFTMNGREVDVDVRKAGVLVLEWAYGAVGRSLVANAALWVDQAVLQAKAEGAGSVGGV